MYVNSADLAARPFAASRPRNPWLSWPLLVGIASFLLPVFQRYVLGDPDTYLHVSVGHWMLAHGQVLTHDPFSFTRLGAAVSAQEWGSDLLIAATFRVAGWSGLVLLASGCFAGTLVYMMRFLLARMEPLHALVLTLLAAFMLFPSLLARPHELVWPLTALWIGTLVRCSEERRAPPWWLLGVMLLWVNLHGSFIVGMGLAAFVGCDAVLAERTARSEQGQSSLARRWVMFCLAACACGFVNPQGYHLILFPFRLLRMGPALSLIAEWQPPNFGQPQILGLWIIAIVGLALGGRIRLSLVRTILVVGLLYMALAHVRNVALLGLLSPFLIARPVAALWRQPRVAGRDAIAIDRMFQALAVPANPAIAGLTSALAILVAILALRLAPPRPPAYARPGAALDAVLAYVPGGRILNDPAFGDYLIYRRIPDFMDDRVDLYGVAFMRETAQALNLAPDGHLERLLRKYRIEGILLGTGYPAVRLLDHLPAWQRVYSDGVAVAFVRRRPLKP